MYFKEVSALVLILTLDFEERLIKSVANMASWTKKLVKIAVGLTTGGIFAVNSASHLFPEKLCRSITEWKPQNGEQAAKIVPVPDRCKIQLKKVLKKLGSESDFEHIRLFICDGYSPVSAGAVWLPGGAVIGLPKYFLFEREEDIMASGLTFRNRAVNWNTKLGRQLASSLLATDDNVAFLIGHELSHIQKNDLLLDVPLAPVWFYSTYKSTFGNAKLLSNRSNLTSFTVKISLCIVSYLVYSMTARWIKLRQEYSADRRSAELDVNMALGGVDFTLKRMKLNSVLRVLYGSDGKKMFSKDGEVLKNYTHPRLMERLRVLEEITAEKMGKIYREPSK